MPARVAFVLAALFAASVAGSPVAAQEAASAVIRGAAEQPATRRAAGATATREVRFWPVAGTGLLGGVAGGGLGYALSNGRDWVGVGGAMLGSAGLAALSMRVLARETSALGRREQRPTLLDIGKRGDAGFQVPAVERRRVPLTPQLGWNVPFLHVQL